MFKKIELPFFVLKRYSQSLEMPIEMDSENIAANLRMLAIKHFQKYAFHSLYFNLKDQKSSENQDMPIELTREALVNQLIENRGGSCYHHNAAFQIILEANGIKSWFVSGLVHNPMQPEETFKMATHIAIVFNYKEASYLFDPGWNGTTFSIYPLPSISGAMMRTENHQVRKTDNPDFPFTFEEIRPNGSIVPRFNFCSKETRLENFRDAITYLNSEDYPFHTLFLFTRITSDEKIILFVNRRLIVKKINGDELHNEELSEETSIIQKLTALFGALDGFMEMINASDFKNPDLGHLICQTARSTLTPTL